MAGRRLTPEERDAWERLARSVRPRRPAPLVEPDPAPPVSAAPRKPKVATSLTSAKAPTAGSEPIRRPVDTLDGSWEKRIRAGLLQPDISIDLHGHSLAAAHMRLDRMLAGALAQDMRVLLVVTGRPRKPSEKHESSSRGAIRAEIGHWLAASPHAAMIASVRAAHPRHGGAGALYIILRRKR